MTSPPGQYFIKPENWQTCAIQFAVLHSRSLIGCGQVDTVSPPRRLPAQLERVLLGACRSQQVELYCLPAVSGCWMRATGWMRSREPWHHHHHHHHLHQQRDVQAAASPAGDGHTRDRGHICHRGQRLCLLRVVTLRWSAEVIGKLRWPCRGRTGRDGRCAGCSRAVCGALRWRRKKKKKSSPPENKASGRWAWKKEESRTATAAPARNYCLTHRGVYTDMG